MSKVLAVVAHPDDEVIGCGATLAKLAEQGDEVRVLLPVRRNDPRGVANWDQLMIAFRRACEHLGAGAVFSPDPIDERAVEGDVARLHDSIIAMVDWADVVFTHWSGDAHQVHRGVGRAVEIATRPFRRRKEVFLFEIATSTEQGFWPSFAPNAHSVITADHARKKCEAMAHYSTELEAGRTPESLMRKLQVRGDEIGVPLAEAFYQARRFF